MAKIEPGIKSYIKDGKTYFQVNVKVEKQGEKATKQKTGIHSLQKAKQIKGEMIREAQDDLDAKLKELSRGPLWKTMVEQWMEAHARGENEFTENINKKTFDGYVSNLFNYTKHWFDLPESEINRKLVKKLFREIEENGSIATRKKVRAAIDHVFEYAIDEEIIPFRENLPTAGYKPKNYTQVEKLPEILTREEIRKFLYLAKRDDSKWYPIWAMALLTGMRSGELFALRWKSIDFENGQIFVHENWTKRDGYHSTKGGYWRTIPISQEIRGLLLALQRTQKGEFVLPHYGEWKLGLQAKSLRAFLKGYGLPSVTFHALRACFATHLIASGIAPATVMKIGGWKKTDTMDRYIRLAGVDVKGATEGLKLLPEDEIMADVVNLFKGDLGASPRL